MHVPNLRASAFLLAAATVFLAPSTVVRADGTSDPAKAASMCANDAYKAYTDAEIQRCCSNMFVMDPKKTLTKQCVDKVKAIRKEKRK